LSFGAFEDRITLENTRRGNRLSRWLKEKRQVLEAAREMLRLGLVVGTGGNVSLRLLPEGGRQLLAITPSSRYYDRLSASEIPVVDFEGQPVEGELAPSVETGLHIAIYQARKNIKAVIHSHPVFAGAISVAGLDIPTIMEDQAAFIGGEIKLARPAPSGSQELVKNTLAALENRNAVLLANHGVVAVGQTMRQASVVCQLVERTAQIYYLALSLGKVNPLPKEIEKAAQAYFDKLRLSNE
jgi:L-ribulose-5-phosphate 4-epimerase